MAKTATNKETGEQVVFLDGEWVPVERTATNKETGEKRLFAKGAWIAADVAPAEEEVDFDAMTMVKNIPSSVAGVAQDIYQAVRHPVQTEEALSGLFQSTLKKGQRKVRELAAGVDIAPEGEESADAAWEALKQRYGSVDRFQRTLMEDPAGVMIDLSAAGTVTRPLRVSRLTQATAALDPINVAANTGKTAVKALTPKEFPQRLYRSANKLKFHEDMPHANQMAALEAGMKYGLRNTARGEAKLERTIAPLKEKLNRIVDEATGSGVVIDSEKLFDYMPELRKSKSGVKVEAIKDAEIINKAEQGVRATLPTNPSQPFITPRTVQDFKTDAYKKVYKALGGDKPETTLADTYGTMARGAKDALEAQVKGTAEINAELGPLLNLKRPLKHAAERLPGDYGNVLRATIPAIAGGGVGLVAGPKAGMATAAGVAAITSPLAKTKLAIALRKLQQGDVGWLQNNLNATELRAVLAVAGRQEDED